MKVIIDFVKVGSFGGGEHCWRQRGVNGWRGQVVCVRACMLRWVRERVLKAAAQRCRYARGVGAWMLCLLAPHSAAAVAND